MGLFVGSIPVFGLHTPLVVGLSIWFQLDGALAWLAANISNPFLAPALLTAEVQVGAFLRTGAPLHPERSVTPAGALAHFIGAMFVGAPVVASLLAIAGGGLTYGLVALTPKRSARAPYRLPEDAPAWLKAVERVAARFASPESPLPGQRTRFHYLRMKLLADPAAKLVIDLAQETQGGFGRVLDLGTGRGQLPLLLLELGVAASAQGVDWDERKVDDARAAATGLKATFAQGDVRAAAAMAPADTVLLIDVLHYFELEEQDRLLDRAAAAVGAGGAVVVREADAARGWRSVVTLVEERFFTFVRFNRGERVVFRPAEQIAARLESSGLVCSVRPAWGSTPFSNVLIVGRRLAPPTPRPCAGRGH